MTAREMIRQEYGESTNFMTPTVVGYRQPRMDRAVEISKGTGLDGEMIYGVSVVDLGPDGETVRRTDLSEMFWSLADAERYVGEEL